MGSNSSIHIIVVYQIADKFVSISHACGMFSSCVIVYTPLVYIYTCLSIGRRGYYLLRGGGGGGPRHIFGGSDLSFGHHMQEPLIIRGLLVKFWDLGAQLSPSYAPAKNGA